MRNDRIGLVFLVASAAACEEAPSPPRTLSVAEEDHQLLELTSAGDIANPWRAVGCERQFPSEGTRFTQLEVRTLKLPPGFQDTFMLDRSYWVSQRIERVAVRIDVVDGERVVAQHRLATTLRTTRATGAIDEAHSSDAAASNDNTQHVRVSGGAGEIARNLAAILDVDTTRPGNEVTLGAPRRTRSTITYPTRVHTAVGEAATSHGLDTVQVLSGKTTFRASDGALVEVTLRGSTTFTEYVAFWRQTNEFHAFPPIHAESTLSIRRDCFR